jgi:hypothetical protein
MRTFELTASRSARDRTVEPLIIAVFGGVVFGLVLLSLIWKIVSRAADNELDWLIHNFGNERAAKRIEEKGGDMDGESSAVSGYWAGPAPLGIIDSCRTR